MEALLCKTLRPSKILVIYRKAKVIQKRSLESAFTQRRLSLGTTIQFKRNQNSSLKIFLES